MCFFPQKAKHSDEETKRMSRLLSAELLAPHLPLPLPLPPLSPPMNHQTPPTEPEKPALSLFPTPHPFTSHQTPPPKLERPAPSQSPPQPKPRQRLTKKKSRPAPNHEDKMVMIRDEDSVPTMKFVVWGDAAEDKQVTITVAEPKLVVLNEKTALPSVASTIPLLSEDKAIGKEKFEEKNTQTAVERPIILGPEQTRIDEQQQQKRHRNCQHPIASQRAVSPNPQLSFLETIGTQTIDLYIGCPRTLYRVHTDLLTRRSPYFRSLLTASTYSSSSNSTSTSFPAPSQLPSSTSSLTDLIDLFPYPATPSIISSTTSSSNPSTTSTTPSTTSTSTTRSSHPSNSSISSGSFPLFPVPAFDAVLGWLYFSTLPAAITHRSSSALETYAIAAKFQLPALQDRIMDGLIKNHRARDTLMSLRGVEGVFRSCTGGAGRDDGVESFSGSGGGGEDMRNGMRSYALATVKFMLSGPGDGEEKGNTEGRKKAKSTKDIQRLLLRCPDILAAVLEGMRGGGGTKEATDPRTEDGCMFHCHGADMVCPANRERNL